MNKKLILSTLFLFLSFSLLAACSAQEGSDKTSNSANKENLAPMFELTDLNGNNVALESFAGEKVYIKYWASWCSACLAGLDDVNELSNEDTEFNVITIVSPSYKGEMKSDAFKSWFQSLDFNNMTVLLDDKGVWAEQFRVLAYPTSYYIDSDGGLVKTVIGNQTNTDIENEFKNIF